MSDTKLKLFEIKNLFNQYDVSIPLDNNINIFLGENGMGIAEYRNIRRSSKKIASLMVNTKSEAFPFVNSIKQSH